MALFTKIKAKLIAWKTAFLARWHKNKGHEVEHIERDLEQAIPAIDSAVTAAQVIAPALAVIPVIGPELVAGIEVVAPVIHKIAENAPQIEDAYHKAHDFRHRNDNQ